MSRSYTGWLWVLLVFGSVWPIKTHAHSPVPSTSYKRETANGKYLFVMLSDLSLEADIRSCDLDQKKAREVLELRQKYPESGMYRNDGSITPLWTVDWYWTNVEVASDGIHLVLTRYVVGKSAKDEAVCFYANGKLVKTIRTGELVDDFDGLPRAGGNQFIWLEKTSYEDSKKTFQLITRDGNIFVFDIRSGNIVYESRRLTKLRILFGIMAGLMGLLICICVIAVRRSRPPSDEKDRTVESEID